jgi:VWFA-related protein
MRPALLLALSLAIPVLLAAPHAAAAQEVQPDEVIKINTDLVVLDAQVISKKNKRIVGELRREDFELYEDGARQEISYFSRDELPLSVMLLLDVSGSVRPIIERVGEGAQDAMSRLSLGDEVAVMAFGTESKLIQGFTRDRGLIADKIKWASREYSVGRGTLLTEALYEAAREMQNSANPASRRVVVVVTDNVAFLGEDNVVRRTRNELLESGTVVYGLVVRAAFGKVFNVLTLGKVNPIEQFSEQTGGEVLGADKKEVDEKLGEMFARLRSRYSLGFKPSNTREDGQLRHLKLQLTPEAVKRNGKVIVVTKQGYYFRRGVANRPARATDPAPGDGAARPRRAVGSPPPPSR